MALNFQELVLNLQKFWSDYGCIIQQPYDIEKGASTMNPATFLRSLGPEPWNTAMIEPCRRPTDARYGENPNRLGHYFQFQVILKPSPDNKSEKSWNKWWFWLCWKRTVFKGKIWANCWKYCRKVINFVSFMEYD